MVLPERPAGFDQWTPATFAVVEAHGTVDQTGWTSGGLGLFRVFAHNARYRRKDGTRRLWTCWAVVHLNSGHSVRWIKDEPTERVFALATEIAAMSDWDFEGLDGWRNRDPDLPDRLAAWHRGHGLAAAQGSGFKSEDQARAIAAARS